MLICGDGTYLKAFITPVQIAYSHVYITYNYVSDVNLLRKGIVCHYKSTIILTKWDVLIINVEIQNY